MAFVVKVSRGPWLRPAFAKMRIGQRRATAIMRSLVDMFNEMLGLLDDAHPRFHHVDLRGVAAEAAGDKPPQKAWHDELHLKSKAYAVAAGRFEDAIRVLR